MTVPSTANNGAEKPTQARMPVLHNVMNLVIIGCGVRIASLLFRIRRRILAVVGTWHRSAGTFCRLALAWPWDLVLCLRCRFPPTLPLAPLVEFALFFDNLRPIASRAYIQTVGRADSRKFVL